MPINHDISAQDHCHHERRNYAKCPKNTGRESAQFMTDWVDSRPACCWIFDVVQTFVVAGIPGLGIRV